MADKKMTRKQALTNVIEHLRDCENYANDDWHEEIEVFNKMIASIDKQANRPKSKTSARIQNENYAKQLIKLLAETHRTEPFNATWIAEHVPFVSSSQRGYHVAKIAIEWGAIEEITIKKRTFYVANENYFK